MNFLIFLKRFFTFPHDDINCERAETETHWIFIEKCNICGWKKVTKIKKGWHAKKCKS
jgi:hypothetical protein